MNVVISAKTDAGLKMTIFDEERSAKISILAIDDIVYATESVDGVSTSRRLNHSESASYLMDMLSVNPGYYLAKYGGFDADIHILSDYHISLNFAFIQQDGIKRPIPAMMELYRQTEEGKELVRRIEYIEFHEPHGRYLRPKKLFFIDVINNRRGLMRLESFEYNRGLPDFIFEAPEL